MVGKRCITVSKFPFKQASPKTFFSGRKEGHHRLGCYDAGSRLLLNHTTTGDVTMNSYVSLSLAARTAAAQRAADFIETKLMGLLAGAAEALPLSEFQGTEVLEPFGAERLRLATPKNIIARFAQILVDMSTRICTV
jgi:hypothetical protein